MHDDHNVSIQSPCVFKYKCAVIGVDFPKSNDFRGKIDLDYPFFAKTFGISVSPNLTTSFKSSYGGMGSFRNRDQSKNYIDSVDFKPIDSLEYC